MNTSKVLGDVVSILKHCGVDIYVFVNTLQRKDINMRSEPMNTDVNDIIQVIHSFGEHTGF